MNKAFAVGRFDLDIALRDASLDEMNRVARRSLANASIGVNGQALDAREWEPPPEQPTV